MANPFPSTYEMWCTALGLVISQGLLLATSALIAVDYNHYDIETEAQIIELHRVVSSPEHRAEIETASGLMWLSFPFFLISLHGVKKLTMAMFAGTHAENVIFVAAQAYTMWIMVVCIIAPALMLASVSFEWSIHEYTPDADFVPTGYYIQAYTILLAQELLDSAALAEGTFTIFFGSLARFASYFASHGHPVFEAWCGRYTVGGCKSRSRCCWEVTTITTTLICIVIFLIALFRFARTGFFSLNGDGFWLLLLSFLLKLLLGLRLLFKTVTGGYQKEVVGPFTKHRAKQASGSQGMVAPAGQGQGQWQMETITDVKSPPSPDSPEYQRYESNPVTPEDGKTKK